MKWIKCSDKMPEKGLYVLVWAIDGPCCDLDFPIIIICNWSIIDRGIIWQELVDGREYEVTHWMTLPEKAE